MDEIQNIHSTEYVVDNLAPSSVYEFFVAAANNIGRSILSAALEVPTGESGTRDRQREDLVLKIFGLILKSISTLPLMQYYCL